MLVRVWRFRRRAFRARLWVVFAACLVALNLSAADLPQVQLSTTPAAAEESASSPERRIRIPEHVNEIGDLFRSDSGPVRPTPPPRPQVRQQQRSILDTPGDWGFATADDVVQEYMSKVNGRVPALMPDGRDWNSLSPVERYYERQMRGRTATNAAPALELPQFNPSFDMGGPSTLNAFRREMPSAGGSFSPRSSGVAEVLGLGHNAFSPEAIRQREAQRQQMDAFRRALDVANPYANPVATGNAMTPDRVPVWNTWQNQSAVNPVNPAATLYTPVPGMPQNPAQPFDPHTQVPTAPQAPQAPGQYSSTTLPNPVPTRTTPPRADFSFPSRAF